MRPLVALDVEEGVSVPELLLALLAERDARALAVPHQHVARQVVELAPAAQPVAPGLPGNAGRSLDKGRGKNETIFDQTQTCTLTGSPRLPAKPWSPFCPARPTGPGLPLVPGRPGLPF